MTITLLSLDLEPKQYVNHDDQTSTDIIVPQEIIPEYFNLSPVNKACELLMRVVYKQKFYYSISLTTKLQLMQML